MSEARGGPASSAAAAQRAKAALLKLAQAKLEPTPANFARAWAEEGADADGGDLVLPARMRPLLDKLCARVADDAALRDEVTAALLHGQADELRGLLERASAAAAEQSQALAGLIERLTRGLERGTREWPVGRKKESLQRVLQGSARDAAKLRQRLTQLVTAWDGGAEPGEAPHADEAAAASHDPAPASPPPAHESAVPVDEPSDAFDDTAWRQAGRELHDTLRAGLLPPPPAEPSDHVAELADQLAAASRRIAAGGVDDALLAELADTCHRVRRWFAQRHRLVAQWQSLAQSLTEGMAELAEDSSWARGQCESLRQRLSDDAGARAVAAASDLLRVTRERQRELRDQRDRARDALKNMIQSLLGELGELDDHTGAFTDKVATHAVAIEQADSLDALTGLVRELAADSRAVHALVSGARERLATEHARAMELQQRVQSLEAELRRLSDEVSTDALTQVANRRGMLQAFEARRSQLEQLPAGSEPPLSVGLIDIDNFKRLNDTLGHAAGDVALRTLAQQVSQHLRSGDHLARFGGEEFVVLLPETAVDEAQQMLTRLQRLLSAALFMHEDREVFVTFSAGVTAWRRGEALDRALERADEALYEAKRTGKNRTCIG